MTAAARVNPSEFFSPAEWGHLTARSRWRGVWLVVHCWAVIGGAMVMGAFFPIMIPLVVMLVGNRQLGLFILMHDAAHGLLHPQRAVNDVLARWWCGSELHAYRPYHLQHHRFVQQTEDPDLVLSAPFPISRASLRRKVIRDLTGQTFFKQRVGPLQAQLKARVHGQRVWPLVFAQFQSQRAFLLGNALGLLTFSLVGLGWVWLLMWWLPLVTWLPLVSRLRNIAEHALIVPNSIDPLRHARTTEANWLERALIAPYWVNYHGEHHLFTQIPCWNLPRAHRLLMARGVTARMEVQSGYARVLRLATTVSGARSG